MISLIFVQLKFSHDISITAPTLDATKEFFSVELQSMIKLQYTDNIYY